MIKQIKIKVPECNFIRDPQETKLGNAILDTSVSLIDDIGFEAFNFKKLAFRIGTTEASVYRYFENKYQLLLYLDALYWGWMNYQISLATHYLNKEEEKIKTAIGILIQENKPENDIIGMNQYKLIRIIQQEGIKSMLSKNVDDVNKTGAFQNYKQLVGRICEWIKSVRPDFEQSNMLVTTIIEAAHLQHFFVEHLPGLTNAEKGSRKVENFLFQLLNDQLFNTPKIKNYD
jgi:AcrR family transcriptional regulator